MRASPRFRLRASTVAFWRREGAPAAACVVVCLCACVTAVLRHRSQLLGACAGFRASSTLRLSLVRPFAPTQSKVASARVEHPVLVLLFRHQLRHFQQCIVKFAPIIAKLFRVNLHAFPSPRFRLLALPRFRPRTSGFQDRTGYCREELLACGGVFSSELHVPLKKCAHV